MEALDQKIGLKLKKIREQLGYSMREVAEKTDIHFTYISKIEKGMIPSLDKLNKLCTVYGITVQSLFGEEEAVPEELKEFGVEWISVFRDIKEEKLTPQDIQNIINVAKSMKLK